MQRDTLYFIHLETQNPEIVESRVANATSGKIDSLHSTEDIGGDEANQVNWIIDLPSIASFSLKQLKSGNAFLSHAIAPLKQSKWLDMFFDETFYGRCLFDFALKLGGKEYVQ